MPTPTTVWRPTVQDVANLIPQRTGDPDGNAQGTFNTTTVPTATQVEGVISQVQADVATAIGDMPSELATALVAGGSPATTAAGRVVVLGAAATVEDSFYPDQQATTPSPASRLWDRYVAALERLKAAASDLADDGDLGGAEAPVLPTATFPETVTAGMGTSFFEVL